MSRALKELVSVDRLAVEGSLNEQEERVAARFKREVGNKLRTGLKNPPTRINALTRPKPA